MAASVPATFLDAFLKKALLIPLRNFRFMDCFFVTTLIYWLSIGGLKAHWAEQV